MKNRITGSFFAVVAMLAFSVIFIAQAAQQPGAGEGAVDPFYPALRNKPIPRRQDGKPDLYGFWAEWRRVAGLPGPVGEAAAERRKEFTENLPEAEPMALTPWAAERHLYNMDPLYHDGDRVRNELDPSSHCFPPGTARLGAPFQIVHTPREVFIIYEDNHEVRQVFMDGRKHPEDYDLTWNGHSIGRWDRDTLVVDTFGLRDETLLDAAGHVHSSELQIVERIRRIAYDVLEIEKTLTDPKALAKPYTTRRTFVLAPPDWDILEDIPCEHKFQRGIWYGEGPYGL